MNRNALATRRTNGSAAPPIRGHVDEQRRIVRSPSGIDGKWTVPVNAMPTLHGYGPNLGVRFNFTMLYPAGKRPEPTERVSFAK